MPSLFIVSSIPLAPSLNIATWGCCYFNNLNISDNKHIHISRQFRFSLERKVTAPLKLDSQSQPSLLFQLLLTSLSSSQLVILSKTSPGKCLHSTLPPVQFPKWKCHNSFIHSQRCLILLKHCFASSLDCILCLSIYIWGNLVLITAKILLFLQIIWLFWSKMDLTSSWACHFQIMSTISVSTL